MSYIQQILWHFYSLHKSTNKIQALLLLLYCCWCHWCQVGCRVGTFLPFISQYKTSPALTTYLPRFLGYRAGMHICLKTQHLGGAWGTGCCQCPKEERCQEVETPTQQRHPHSPASNLTGKQLYKDNHNEVTHWVHVKWAYHYESNVSQGLSNKAEH